MNVESGSATATPLFYDAKSRQRRDGAEYVLSVRNVEYITVMRHGWVDGVAIAAGDVTTRVLI